MRKGKLVILLVSLVAICFWLVDYVAQTVGGSVGDALQYLTSPPPEWTNFFIVEQASLFALIAWVFLFIYTPIDAKKHGHSMPLWGALSFFFGPVSCLIYAVSVKDEKKEEKKKK